jgi:hypothetical protein
MTPHDGPPAAGPAQGQPGGRPPGGSGEAPGPFLTDHEQEASRQAGLLHSYIAAHVIPDGPTREEDLSELTFYVHGIQRMMLAQAASRLYPGKYRPLGGTVPLLAHLPPPGLPSPGQDA